MRGTEAPTTGTGYNTYNTVSGAGALSVSALSFTSPDSLVSGSFTTIKVQKPGNASVYTLKNGVFSNVRVKGWFRGVASGNTFTILGSTTPTTASWSPTGIRAHLGDGSNISNIVIEAPLVASADKRRVVMSLPQNIASNTSTTAYTFGGSTNNGVFLSTFTTATGTSSSNLAANSTSVFGTVTHDLLNRSLEIKNVTLTVKSGTGTTTTLNGGKFKVYY